MCFLLCRSRSRSGLVDDHASSSFQQSAQYDPGSFLGSIVFHTVVPALWHPMHVPRGFEEARLRVSCASFGVAIRTFETLSALAGFDLVTGAGASGAEAPEAAAAATCGAATAAAADAAEGDSIAVQHASQ